MAYCSVQDVRRALVAGGASASTNTAADISDDALDDAAEEASSTIDAFIDGPYDPEEESIPSVIRFWARDIAAYLAMLTWRGAKAPAANNPVTLRYQHAMQMLQGVADGTIEIMTPQSVEDQPAVINQYTGSLFDTDDFDLVGRGESQTGWWWQSGSGEVGLNSG